MTLTNGAQACNVYWQVGSSATLGVTSTFVGHVYALTSITASTGASIQGQLLARNGAVTLDANTIVNSACVNPVVVVPVVAPVVTPVVVVPAFPGNVSTALCTSTDVHKISLIGEFPLNVTRVSVNGVNLANYKWIQSGHRVVVTLSPGSTQTFNVDLFAGETQLAATATVVCPEAVSVVTPTETPSATPTPTPTPTVIAVETPTVTGGELPNTGSNTYTYLLIGFVLMGVGAGSLLIRNRVQS
jgi:type VI secretion system secreted protein VgrG